VAVPRVDLADVLGATFLAPTIAAKKLVFHAVGDTGAAKVNSFQSAAQALVNQASVADAMARDVEVGGQTGPAFFFHLGDVVYNFGEGQYYYDQFYEPFRNTTGRSSRSPATTTEWCSARRRTYHRCRH
jgi:hypothetical protein